MDIFEVMGIERDDLLVDNGQELYEADQQLIRDLVEQREARGLKQADVAAKLGIDPGAISRFESGNRDLHLSTIRRYAAVVGARIEHVVTPFESSVPKAPKIIFEFTINAGKISATAERHARRTVQAFSRAASRAEHAPATEPTMTELAEDAFISDLQDDSPWAPQGVLVNG